MEKFKIKTYEMTCSACPSQWDLFTDDDRYIYVRYRHGHFKAELDSVLGEPIFEWYSDDGWGGSMGNSEMMKLLSGILDFSEAKEVVTEYEE